MKTRKRPQHLLKQHLNNLGYIHHNDPKRLLPELVRFHPYDFSEFRFIRTGAKKLEFRRTFGNIYSNKGAIMAKPTIDWTFIDIKLSDSDKPKIAAFMENYDNDAWEAVGDVLELQYKVSASWVATHSAYCVTVSGNDKVPENNKRSITSWSNDLVEAYAMMAYKVLHVTKGSAWDGYATEKHNWG